VNRYLGNNLPTYSSFYKYRITCEIREIVTLMKKDTNIIKFYFDCYFILWQECFEKKKNFYKKWSTCILYIFEIVILLTGTVCKHEKWKIVDSESDLWKFPLSFYPTVVSFNVNAFHEYACVSYAFPNYRIHNFANR